MERIYYSRENYNASKIQQYEEYIKRQNSQYINMKKYYEEYIKRQNSQYINMKEYYEEYIKNQNSYYINMIKYHEEHKERNKDEFESIKDEGESISKDDKSYISQDELFNYLNMINIEDNNIKDNSMEKNIHDFLETDTEESNSEHKNDDKYQYDYLENNSFTNSKDSNKEESLEENEIEHLENNHNDFLEEDYSNLSKEELNDKGNISDGSLFVKFPVILAESDITIPMEDTITLDQEVKEIKGIKKKLFLVESNLLPFSSGIVDHNSGVLFIKGFIRKSIEYEVKTYNEIGKENSSGKIKQCMVEVPFNFTTRVTFLRPPIFIENYTSQLEFLKDTIQSDDLCEDSLIGRDTCEKGFRFKKVFNEKPFVELVKVTFVETDINRRLILRDDIPTEKIFTEITEKMIINLIINVLQKQQLKVAIE